MKRGSHLKRFKETLKSLKNGESKRQRKVREAGIQMYYDNKKELEAFVRSILDAKYGGQQKN